MGAGTTTRNEFPVPAPAGPDDPRGKQKGGAPEGTPPEEFP